MVRFSVITIGLALLLSIWAFWPKAGAAINTGATAPEVAGENWLNSKPLTMAGLKGHVVLVEFWTYG
jgi:hypothetical protein